LRLIEIGKIDCEILAAIIQIARRENLNRLKSNGAARPSNKVAAISPITGENLNPCPEQGLKMRTCGQAG
jgi:hypothetical protein